jgi:DNA primase
LKIEVEETEFMATEWVSFSEIKAAVTLEMVFARYGIALRRVNKSSLRGKCSLPTHGSDDSKTSFGAQIEKNAWACQSQSCVSARGGRRGGNVLDFVAVMESCSIRDAALKLQDWFLSDGAKPALPVPSQRLAEEGEYDGANKPLAFALGGVYSAHPWLEGRGITKETAGAFGVGFFPGKGLMTGRVVIPIHNKTGELVAYAGRALDDETEPRYLLPAGFNKTQEVYNLHRATRGDASRGVVVVEGFFDTLKVHQAGFSAVVALMGSSLSDTQAELIATNFRRAIVMLDSDTAGYEALPGVVARLAGVVDVRIAAIPDGCQPDALSAHEIKQILKRICE